MNVMIFTAWPVAFWQVPNQQVERLRQTFREIRFAHVSNDAEASAALETAQVALASRLSPAMVEQAPQLRWVHSTAAAVGIILPLKELALRNIAVTNSRGIQAVPMAEHVLGGLLVLARKFDVMLAAQRERRWIQNDLTKDAWPWSLHGKSMTIVGLGTTGLEIARRAHVFGMRVTGIRRRTDQPKPSFLDRVAGPDQLDEMLRGCDVLVITAPFLASTDQLIRAGQIALLRPGAILVNVARGRIVEEAALISALQTGRLGGAVLDVFDREPLDPSSALWSLPNVLISPHCSGVRPDHWEKVIDLFSENLRRFQLGEPLLNTVDLEAGY